MPKTVFITGASTGIGRAAAILFRDKGWNVAATMRRPEDHQDLASDTLKLFALDVTQPDTIAPVMRAAVASLGPVDVLVNNAGYGCFGPVEAASNEQIERQFSTNVTGLIYVTREFITHFRERNSGVIVNISSVGGRAVFPLYSLYHGTKWAVEGFSESLQFEVEPFGIRVKLVEPGAIATDFSSRSLDRAQKDGLTAYDAFVQKIVAGWTANRRYSPAELVAGVIFQAATDGTSQLRYVAGADAEMILENRAKISQDEYYALIKSRFGI